MESFSREDLTLGHLLEIQADRRRGKPFLKVGGLDLTYGQFDQMVNRTANGYARRGVKRGDKVAVMLPNSPEVLYSLFGLAKLGAVSVPINTAYKGDILAHVLSSSDAQMLVVDEEWLDRVAVIEGKLPGLSEVLVHSADKPVSRPSGLRKPMENLRTLLDSPASAPDVRVLHSEVQSLMYTSGTTGPSKGVEVTHAHGPTAALGYIEFARPTEEDVIFTVMPLFHGVGFWRILGVLMTGSSAVVADRFSASQWWPSVRRAKATIGIGIFAIPSILLGQTPSPEDKSHALRILTPAPSALDHSMYERFGVHTVENYGGTEVGICAGAPFDQAKPGSCGRPRADIYEVKILDEYDRELPAGQSGEICVRPRVPFAMTTGYYNAEAAAVRAFRNLWFHTGDRGSLDQDGYLFFSDRLKDVVRRRGENISSFEVERAINAHPAVAESAIIAVPSNLGEDDVKACVVLQKDAHLDPEQLLDFCQEHLPYFMVPRYVEFMRALPKTPTEKIEKYKLRSQGNEGITPDTWDREKAGYIVRR